MASKTRKSGIWKRKNVSRACGNCRKRKIKCSGTFPCFNCVSYDCKCDLDDMLPPMELVKIYGSNECISTSGESNKTIENLVRNNFVPRLTSLNDDEKATAFKARNGLKRKFSELKSTVSNEPNSALVIDKHESTIGDSQDKSLLSRQESNDSSEASFDTLYENDIEQQPKYQSLMYSLKYLKNSPIQSDEIKELIKITSLQINQFIENWTPNLKLEKVHSLQSDEKSIETKLMKNKYVSKVYLTNFACVNTGQQNKNISIGNGKNSNRVKNAQDSHNCSSIISNRDSKLSSIPLLNETYGLYSPYETMSLHGIGDLIQKYALDNNLSNELKQKVKGTLVIFLRYVDLSCLHLNENVAIISNPIETYIQNSITAAHDFGTKENKLHLTNENITKMNTKELIKIIINSLPQLFTENNFCKITSLLLNNVTNNFKMFELIIDLISTYGIKLASIMLKVTHKDYHGSNAEMTENFKNFKNICKFHDTLIPLSYHYYNATLYHLNGYKSIKYLRLLFHFMEYLSESGQWFGLGKVISTALNYCNIIGISRWEYYVGMDENEAEQYRTLWWNIYYHEVEFMISHKSGQSLIDDCKINCLLPEVFRKLGFIDHRKFIRGIANLGSENETLKLLNIAEITSYGYISLAILLSNFYNTVLYNERYTDIMNACKPQYIKESYAREIFIKLDELQNKFDCLEKQLGALHDCNLYGKRDFPFKPNDDVYKSKSFIVSFNTHKVLFLRATLNLIKRLNINKEIPFVLNKFKKYANCIYQCWCINSDIMLNFETSCEIWLTLEKTIIPTFLCSSRIISDYQDILLEDIVKQLQIYNKMLYLTKAIFLPLEEDIFKTKILTDNGRIFSLLIILIRLMLIDYMRKNRLDQKSVCEMINKIDSNVIFLVEKILDHNSSVFAFILQPMPRSGFHLNVNQLLTNKLSDINEDYNFKSDDKMKLFSNAVLYNTKDNLFPIDERSPKVLLNKLVETVIELSANQKDKTDNLEKLSAHESSVNEIFSLEDLVLNTDLDDLYKSFWNVDYLNDIL